MCLSRPRSARSRIKLLVGMTQPPRAPLIDLGWGVCADFTTSLVETAQQEKWQLLREYLYSFFHRLVDVLFIVIRLQFHNLVFSIMTLLKCSHTTKRCGSGCQGRLMCLLLIKSHVTKDIKLGRNVRLVYYTQSNDLDHMKMYVSC